MKRALPFLLVLFLCGCNVVPHKTVSLEQSRIITVIGIDVTENGYRVSCFEGTDLSEETEPSPERLFTIDGNTLRDATTRLFAASVHRPMADYASVILLGKELLEGDPLSALTELYDIPELPFGVPVLMAEPSAHTVLDALAKKTADLSGSIDAMLQSANRLSLPEAPTLPRFYNLLLSPHKTPTLPCLNNEDDVVALSGVGVFQHGVLTKTLTDTASKGLGVLSESVRDYPLSLDFNTTVYLRRAQVTKKKNEVHVMLYADTGAKENAEALSKAVETEIRGWINEAFNALQNTPLELSVKCRIKEMIS